MGGRSRRRLSNYLLIKSALLALVFLLTPFFSSNNTVSALDQPRIDARAGPGGSITPAGVVSVPNGHDKTFTIIPLSGYRILDVLVDGSSVGSLNTYTVKRIGPDRPDRCIE